jgi:hypothetical protein
MAVRADAATIISKFNELGRRWRAPVESDCTTGPPNRCERIIAGINATPGAQSTWQPDGLRCANAEAVAPARHKEIVTNQRHRDIGPRVIEHRATLQAVGQLLHFKYNRFRFAGRLLYHFLHTSAA